VTDATSQPTDVIGAGTNPDAIPCDDSCGRQAQLTLLSFADRGVDYLCWPCLLTRTMAIAAEQAKLAEGEVA